MPADTNPHGDIFGGWLMAQMDLAGGSAAVRRARGRVATVAVASMTFHRPVKVGDEVSLYARVIGVGRSSIRVFVEAWRRPALGVAARSPRRPLCLSLSARTRARGRWARSHSRRQLIVAPPPAFGIV